MTTSLAIPVSASVGVFFCHATQMRKLLAVAANQGQSHGAAAAIFCKIAPLAWQVFIINGEYDNEWDHYFGIRTVFEIWKETLLPFFWTQAISAGNYASWLSPFLRNGFLDDNLTEVTPKICLELRKYLFSVRLHFRLKKETWIECMIQL